MKKRNIKQLTFFSSFLTFAFILSSKVFATEIDWPASPMGTELIEYGTTTLTDLVQYFYEWGISIGALFAFISIVVAGFQYLTSVGNPFKIAQAMERIKASFLGLALLLGTFLILNTINPELTILDENSNVIGENTLQNFSFIDYDFTTECAYAKIYANTEDMKKDSEKNYDKNSGYGKTILVGGAYTKGVFPLGDNTVYTVVKFFSVPNLTRITKTYSIDDVSAAPEETLFEYHDGSGPEEYPQGYKKLLIEGSDGNYVESTGTECILYFFNESTCSSLPGALFGVSNVTYPSNNLAQSSNADPNSVRCYLLQDNN